MYYYTDAIEELAFLVDDPNDRNYDATSLGTWSSLSQVDTFLATYNRASAYKTNDNKLRIGNRITISDGTYNAVWMIVGFDLESSRKASDDTTYDNGYGIALVPVTQLTTGQWNTSNTTSGGYKSSYMHTTIMSTVATNLKKVLGTHLVNRNVLLSSSISGNNSNAYTWTTAYATLMSIGQMTGTFASHNNKYDDGEANYKLPVFNDAEIKTGSYFWSRCVRGSGSAWYVYSDGSIYGSYASSSYGVRPLIYIR